MISVSNAVKEAYDKSTTQIDKIILDGQEYRISKVQYDDDCYKDGNVFGTAIARSLEFEIENNVNLEQKEFEYLTGVYIENSITWISLGNFITQEVESNDTTNINKIFSIDYMLKSNIEYRSSLDYSSNEVTLLQVVQEACDNAGLQLATLDFANNNFIVDSNQFEDKTLIRQVFQAVAQISGSIAKIKNDNLLYFINPKTTDTVRKVFTLNNYSEADIKRDTHPLNVVSIGMDDVEGENVVLRDEASIALNGENILEINDNPFAYTQEKRTQLITALFNAIKGFEYKAFSFKCQAIPYLETMDKVQFKDKEGNTYDSFLFRFNYKSPNGLESTTEAPSIIKATVNYQNVLSAIDIAKRTEIIVNKQEQTIQGLAEKQSETTYNLTQMKQDINEFDFKIQSAGGVNLIQNSTLAQGLDVNNTYSGTISLEKNIDIKNNTISKSAIKINTGYIKVADIYIAEGETYTYSCLIWKNELTNVYVRITSDIEVEYEIECQPEKFQLFSFQINSTVNKVTIELGCDNNYCMVADRMLNKGSNPLSWQPYTGELTTENVKIGDNGISVESSQTQSRFIIDSEEAKVVNKDTGETQVTFNGDRTELTRALIEDMLTIGKLRITVLDNGDVMMTFDD